MIVTCGDGCLNIIFEIKENLQIGANHDIQRVVRRPGGNALVTAMALSRWGLKTAYLGVLGTDAEGRMLRSWLQAAGVEGSGVISRPAPTLLSYVILDQSDRTILDQRAASVISSELRLTDWRKTPDMEKLVETAGTVMLDRYCSEIHDPVKNIFQQRRRHGEKPLLVYRTGSRPSPGLIVEGNILSGSDIALTKGAFLKNIGLEQNWVESCKRLSKLFDTPLVIATIGSEGAAFYEAASDSGGIVPAIPVIRPFTTLGGGDFFRAGFLLAYTEGMPLVKSILIGHTSAATHISRPESEDLETLFFARSQFLPVNS